MEKEKNTDEIYEMICNVALDECHNAWKIERLGYLHDELNKLYRKLIDYKESIDKKKEKHFEKKKR